LYDCSTAGVGATTANLGLGVASAALAALAALAGLGAAFAGGGAVRLRRRLNRVCCRLLLPLTRPSLRLRA
jgi:hypothetical protein